MALERAREFELREEQLIGLNRQFYNNSMALLLEKGKQVVFTQRKKIDIPLHDHLFVVFGKQGVVEHLVQVLLIPPGEESKGLGNPEGGLL